ncbi:unnamed protein product [Adineta ricciae]|uniref:DED domain-containing protein n=1 Tax=Adineta ricciae TaxID=249248 RepID=A0A815THL2_ADIRI|nr:unnamed protein product [Adineta ricciae]CAF1526303.1 unnamed protein product [Adineta ricciae]
MEESKIHFRQVIIEVLDHLSSVERKKLSFLLHDDIERRICDDPTIGGALDSIQQLVDRGKISEEDFSYLIDAFQRIKCYQAVKSLKKLQKNQISRSSTNHYSNSNSNENKSFPLIVKKYLEDEEDEIPPTNHTEVTIENHVIKPYIEKEESSKFHPNIFSLIYFKSKRLIWLLMLIIFFLVILLSIIVFKRYYSSSKVNIKPSTTTTMSVISSSTNDPQCELPIGRSCTSDTPLETKAEGLGVYYEEPCYGVGCGFLKPYCRLCWIDPEARGKMDRPKCPPCVQTVLNQ